MLIQGAPLLTAGLPTVEHNEMHSASPTWLFVSDYKKQRTKSRVAEEEPL